jgi:Calcineurin-like phosphoesterase
VIRITAIGDVHGQWPEVWQALKAASACDQNLGPTAPVIDGFNQVIFMGDLVHYKDARDYAQAVGEEPYDPKNPKHLKRAAKAQIRELYRFKDFVDKSYGGVTVILGNHDESAINHKYELSTRSGLIHDEFNDRKGGFELPDDLKAWMAGFTREKLIDDVQFAHAGPLPGMHVFDDFFYSDDDTKRWWYTKPDLLRQTGHRFGVYGHTVMEEGIYIDKDNDFAMIDALGKRQYLEMLIDKDKLEYNIIKF